MADIQIEVTIYEGYRGAERPSSLLFEGNRVTVVRLLRTWVEEEYKTRKQKRFFALQGSDRHDYTLYYDIDLADWFLRSREQSGSEIK